ncbi:HlyD family secretion protein, partial [Aquifex sp.]
SYSDLEKLDNKVVELIEKINQIRLKLKIINEIEKHIKNLKFVERELLQKNRFAKLVDNYFILLSAPENGRIVSKFRNPGEYIKQGEPIVILEINSKDLYVIARFKKDEGKFISIGDRAKVYFPNIDKYSDGVVIGIGKAALSEESLVSETEEYALRDVPVKIKLINPPEGLHYGMKAEVLIETKHYKPFIFTFIQNLLR